MDTLKITMVQADIVWEQKAANLENYNKLLATTGHTDLIVLPEMFTTGFSMEPEKLMESLDGPSVEWMKDVAAKWNAAVTGTLIIEDEGKYYNRCLWVFPDGNVSHYNKRHLFSMGNESSYYKPGDERLIVEYRGWRVCPLICYDLRFPVWSRNTDNYDLLIYMANWPASRHHVWKSLLVARAIENQCYCVGVNKTGNDGENNSYRGDSVLVDAKGNAEFLGSAEKIETRIISYTELHDFRNKFPVLNDQDRFTFK